MEKENRTSQHRSSVAGSSQHRLSGNQQHRSSAATAIYNPDTHEAPTANRDSDDFNDYHARRSEGYGTGTSEIAPNSTMETSVNDDMEFSPRGVHIPARTRYVNLH